MGNSLAQLIQALIMPMRAVVPNRDSQNSADCRPYDCESGQDSYHNEDQPAGPSGVEEAERPKKESG